VPCSSTRALRSLGLTAHMSSSVKEESGEGGRDEE
jgi:hypothetical protein